MCKVTQQYTYVNMITTQALDTYSISELRNHSIHFKNNTRQKNCFLYLFVMAE